jgi:hypothetical protein
MNAISEQSSSPEFQGSFNKSSPTLSYYTASPNKHTFQNRKVRNWVLKWIPQNATVLDACAGETILPVEDLTRNDIAGGDQIDTEVDVANLSSVFREGEFGCVIYDPPFGPGEAADHYTSPYPGYHEDVKEEIDYVLKEGGVVIQLGYTPVGMSPDSYAREALTIINTLGRNRDWVGVVDRKLRKTGSGGLDLNGYWSDVGRTEVRLNEGEGTKTDVGATERVEMNITYLETNNLDNPLTIEEVRDVVADHVEGRVLYPLDSTPISQARTIDSINNKGEIDSWQSTTLSNFMSNDSPDTRVPLTDVDDVYASVFDTVVFAPPQKYFSTCIFDENGENQGGVNRKAKEAFDSILAPGGKVIQVGHTTTNMPGELGYERQAVHLLSPLGTARYNVSQGIRYTPKPIFVSVDEKTSTKGVWPAPPAVDCIHCGQIFPAEPQAVDRSCPQCGAVKDAYCIDHDSGEVLKQRDGTPIYHTEREQIYERIAREMRLGDCPASPDGTHRISPQAIVNLPGF